MEKKKYLLFIPLALSMLMVATLIILNADQNKNVFIHRGEILINKLYLEIEDGDTVVYRGDYIRFLGVDTPEIRNPDVGIYEDQPYGREAEEFTRREIMKAKTVTFIPAGVDRYGRTLAHLFVDGYPLSLKIVEAGYGYETVSSFGDNGFPDIAEKILNAAKLHRDLPFENPWYWRKKHQIKKH